jgi:broad specificity phosphatase PhoE
MNVYFIRHGHALHNAGFDAIGEAAYTSAEYAHSTLTEKGHLQTQSVKVPLLDAVYCSPLVRCIQSARNIFGQRKILQLYDGLLETQGHHPCNVREPVGVIESKYGPVSTLNLRQSGPMTETPEMVKERAEQTLTAILHNAWIHNYSSVAIVTHHDWLFELLGTSLANAEVYRKHYSVTELRERFY